MKLNDKKFVIDRNCEIREATITGLIPQNGTTVAVVQLEGDMCDSVWLEHLFDTPQHARRYVDEHLSYMHTACRDTMDVIEQQIGFLGRVA